MNCKKCNAPGKVYGEPCQTCREAKKKRKKDRRGKAEHTAEKKAHKGQKPIKSIVIEIQWKRSYMWGNNPHASASIEYKDGTTQWLNGYTCSGCGYDKESTVIASIFNDLLRYKLYRNWKKEKPYGCDLYDKKEGKYPPHFNGGVGMSCYYAISDFIGGRFENVKSGKTYDIFKYTDRRAAKLPPEADPFGPLKGLMALGALMADTPEQKNKNVKAALSTTPGLDFPDDWDSLSEKEKTRRLEGVKKVLK